MEKMRNRKEASVFFLVVLVLLLVQFRTMLAPGHSLSLAQIEDPAPRFSFFPWDALSARELRAGRFPLWNPDSGTGMPHLANLQSSPLFPLKWLYFLWPSPRALDLMVILRLALAGTFAFLFCRGLKLPALASGLGGIAFALSGYFMKHLNVVNVNSEMWLPLLLYLVLREKEAGPSLWRVLVSGVVWAMVFEGGNPEAAFYVVFIVVLFAAVELMSFSKLVPVLGGPLILGGLIASPQLLPFFEYLPQSWHLHDPSLHLLGRLPARQIASLVAPWLLGSSGANPAQLLFAPYLGMAPLLLALLAAAHSRGLRRPLFLIGLSALLLALIYDLPPLGFLAYLPPLDRFAHGKFAFAGLALCLSALAAHGLALLAAGRIQGKTTALALALPAILLLAGTFDAKRQFKTIAIGGFMTPFIVLIVAAALLVFYLSRKRAQRTTAETAANFAKIIALLALLELMALFLGFNVASVMDPALVRFQDPARPQALDPIARDPDLPRFTGIAGVLHHNLNLLYGLSDLRAFEGLYPERYVKAMGSIEKFSLPEAAQNFMSHGWSFDVQIPNLGHPLVNLMGVKYVASETPIPLPGFTLVRDGAIKVYQNQKAFPRAWLVPEGKTANPADVSAIQSAKISASTFDRVELSATGPGDLVLADTYFPGWSAEVGAREVPIQVSHDLFRSVKIKSGESRVIMTYRPWAFRIGLWMALFTLVAMVPVTAMKISRRKS